MSLQDFMEDDTPNNVLADKAMALGFSSYNFGTLNPWHDHRFLTLTKNLADETVVYLRKYWRAGLKVAEDQYRNGT